MAKYEVVAIRLDTKTRDSVNRLAASLDVRPTVLMRRMIERETQQIDDLAKTDAQGQR